jgi:hypothetical protein
VPVVEHDRVHVREDRVEVVVRQDVQLEIRRRRDVVIAAHHRRRHRLGTVPRRGALGGIGA